MDDYWYVEALVHFLEVALGYPFSGGVAVGFGPWHLFGNTDLAVSNPVSWATLAETGEDMSTRKACRAREDNSLRWC